MIETHLFKSKFIAAAKPSEKLMIVLHGKGDSFHPFKKFNLELNLPDMNYLLLNAPKKYLGGYSWYGEPPYQREGVLRVREKMFQLLKDLEEQGWKAHNIFFLGFSQGCLVGTDVALHYPKKLAGVVGISGYFNFEPRWRKNIAKKALQTPWLLTHGKKDDVIPIEETKFGLGKLRKIGLDIDWIESEKKHVFDENDYKTIVRWISELRN